MSIKADESTSMLTSYIQLQHSAHIIAPSRATRLESSDLLTIGTLLQFPPPSKRPTALRRRSSVKPPPHSPSPPNIPHILPYLLAHPSIRSTASTVFFMVRWAASHPAVITAVRLVVRVQEVPWMAGIPRGKRHDQVERVNETWK